MGTGTPPPVEQARSIFDDLGYTLSGEGADFTAERKWRNVHVTATADAESPPTDDAEKYRCFVTWDDHYRELGDRLERVDPDYEWAVIGVSREDDYEVLRATPDR